MPSSKRTTPKPARRAPRRSPRGWKRATAAPRVRLRLALIAGAVALLLAFPPTRRVAAAGWAAWERAVAETRRHAAQERLVAEYARRYGISPDLAAAIERAAAAEGVETELAFRLVRVESAFHDRAVSPVGALGLTQLMPATAAEMQPGITREQILERDTNLRLGMRYLRTLLRLYDGDREEALHAYNRGMGTVARIRARGGDPANGYARAVLGPVGASPVRRTAPGSATAPSRPPLHETAPAAVPAGM